MSSGHTTTAQQLRDKIKRYEQTKKVSAKSMHTWLDMLIAATEAEINELGDAPSAPPSREVPATPAARPRRAVPAPPAPVPSAPPPPPSRNFELRSTYPFDENAPRQRFA